MKRLHPDWPLALLVAWGLLLLPLAALGQSPASPSSRSSSRPEGPAFSLQGGVGFTADPSSFLMEFEGELALDEAISFGPALQIGVKDDFVLVSPTLFTRYRIGLGQAQSEGLRRLTPYFQAGLGLTYIERERGRGPGRSSRDRDDVGFLMSAGFGAEYALTERVSMGSRMLFNVLPESVVGENFYFSWQVASLRYRF